MPWKSKAQERWGNSPSGRKALGGKSAVKEWNDATNQKTLPARVKKHGPLREADFRTRAKQGKI